MQSRSRAFACFVLTAVLASGCGRYFAPDRASPTQIGDSQIVGQWKLTTESSRLMEGDGYSAERAAVDDSIIFNSDKTCKVASAIDDYPSGEFIDGIGTWILTYDEASRNTLEIAIENHGSYTFGIADDGDGIILFRVYGDPDSWEFIEFNKDGA